MLSFLKLDGEKLKEAVLKMDSETLTSEALEALASILPQDDEVKAVKKAQEAPDADPNLPPADAYVAAISTVPRLQFRIDAWTFKNEFANAVKGVRAQQQTLRRIEETLINSQKLQVCAAWPMKCMAGTLDGTQSEFKQASVAACKTEFRNENCKKSVAKWTHFLWPVSWCCQCSVFGTQGYMNHVRKREVPCSVPRLAESALLRARAKHRRKGVHIQWHNMLCTLFGRSLWKMLTRFYRHHQTFA